MGASESRDTTGCTCLPFLQNQEAVSGVLQPQPLVKPKPCAYSIAGTWSGWTPKEMEWNGSEFTYIVTVGNNKWEAFQILQNGSWDTVVYPSIKDANPQMVYTLRGPDNHNTGYNWVMGKPGFNPFKKDVIPPGTQYKVSLHVSKRGQPESLNWEMHHVSSVPASRLEMPEVTYHIAGTWAQWTPAPMAWDGDCFSFMVRIGSNGWEAFQLCIGGSWDKVIYPSIKDAHPYTHYEFRGPDNKNRGYNWVIGKAGHSLLMGKHQFAPGTRVKVKVFIGKDGEPKRLGWDVYSGERADRPTMVCLAGLASGSLEVVSHSQKYVGWCRVKELVKNPAKVFKALSLRLVDGTLKDGRVVKCTADMEGLDVRPVAGMQGIKSLSPPGSIQIPVWGPLIDQLEGDFQWHAFSYDWRRWGDERFAEQTVERFRKEVEEAIQRDNHPSKKASLIGHSMGCTVILYVLSVIGDAWVKKNIDQVILVAPAHMGSPSMVSSYAHCPFVDTESWIPVPGIFDEVLGDLTSTWACMIAEMPVHVGGVAPFPEDHAFAITPLREYRLADIGQFLTDVSNCKAHRETGPALWPSVCRMAAAIRSPLVPTTFIYSDSVDTPAQVEYKDFNLGAAPKLKKTLPGDGTIVASSIEVLAEAWKRQGAKVRLVKEPAAEGTTHKGLIACPFTTAIVPAVMSGKDLTPLRVTVHSAQGLKNTDMGLAGLSDPYCRFQIPGKPVSKRETHVIQNNLNPVWNFCETIYDYREGDSLTFNLYDMDLGCTDGDSLGCVTMSAQQVRAGFDGELSLDADPGTLRVKVERLPPM
mmetsp:Transcript_80831/g.237576  ORF Transcript_80831/g.237576 Transcript_80831/m.237576 type:complete len:807 (+) Transcript_80831:58-2478(+)